MSRLRGDLPGATSGEVRPHIRDGEPAAAGGTVDDGRNIDPTVGVLEGEAAGVRIARAERRTAPTDLRRPEAFGASSPPRTYYGQPLLKAPVWKAWIPTYFFVGGLAGGCLCIGAAAQLVGRGRLARLVMPARIVGAAGVMVSAALLVADLGRPARFLHMLRVFRPTSPMNVGTWILTGAGGTAAASVVLPSLGAPLIADGAAVGAGALGLGLASYTAVLLANTAVPAWQHGARTLPPLFTASAAASAAAALDLFPALGQRVRRTLSVVAAAGKVGELAAGALYERMLARVGPAVVRHLRTGHAGTFFRGSQALTAAGLVGALLRKRRVSALLGLAGALALRFAVTEAGRASALDPRATTDPQRRAATHPAARRPERS